MAKGAEDEVSRARIAALEAELKSERAQFALAERAGRIGYWRLRLSDGQQTWSPGMYRLLGADPEVQAPDNDWLHAQIEPDDVKTINEKVATAIRTRSPFYYRSRAQHAETVAQIVDTHGEVEIGPDGLVVAVIGVSQDVTKQVIAEAQRAEAQERYRVMMKEASDVIMLYGEQGRVEFVSSALERILGRSSREFDDQGYLAFVHPDDRAEAEKISTRPPSGKTLTATYRVRHADGHYIWMEVTTRSVFDDETGEFRHIVAVSRDVSERKAQELAMEAAREAAEAANRTKSTFLANMSHELRTPLNAIIGFTDVMRQEMFGPIANDRYREYVSLIHKSGQLLLELIGDVLDMARIEAGKVELNFEQMNLADTVEECVQMLTERATRGGVRINVVVPAQGVLCSADRRAMKQIVINLLSNAVKFTPTGGQVDVAASVQDEMVRIEVRDNGIGIAKEHLPRLANPFEQVCSDPQLAKSGTGLGLALVRALAENHGGHLKIESPAHKGTIVTVEFPRFAMAGIHAA
jgi:PAS domain S-box-containing protein